MEPTPKSSLLSFFHYVKNHQILISRSTRPLGILYTLIGWFLVAISLVYFTPQHDSSAPLTLNMLVSYLSGTLVLLVYSILLKQPLNISKGSDLDRKGHFSLRFRKNLVYLRGFIAGISYIGLVAAKKTLGIVNDSAIFGADALVYAILVWFFLKEKKNVFEWIGILVGTAGVALPFFVNAQSVGLALSLKGGMLGIISSVSMSIIFFFNAALVRHEPPARIAFYQCLIGSMLALILLGFSASTLVMALKTLTLSFYIKSMINGLIFAVALVFFFKAFLYTEVILIAITGYALDPITICIEGFQCGFQCVTQNFVTVILIFVGTALLYIAENRKSKRATEAISSTPIYEETPSEEFRENDEQYKKGQISDSMYLAKKKEFYNLLYEVSDELDKSSVDKIMLEDGMIQFTLKDPDIFLECDNSCIRSAAYDVISFDHYCQRELQFIYSLLEDQAVIIDFNAQVGWLSLNFAKSKPASQIYAFEVQQDCYRHLTKNIEANHCPQILMVNQRLSDENKKETLLTLPDLRILLPKDKGSMYTDLEEFEVTSITLDHFVKEKQIPHMDLIMGLATGYEIFTLRGAQESLSQFKPVLFLELIEQFCTEFESSIAEIIEFLATLGYEPFQITDKNPKAKPSAFYFFFHKEQHLSYTKNFDPKLIIKR